LQEKYGGTQKDVVRFWPPIIPKSKVINTNPLAKRLPSIYDTIILTNGKLNVLEGEKFEYFNHLEESKIDLSLEESLKRRDS
jgi:hypothetical protein